MSCSKNEPSGGLRLRMDRNWQTADPAERASQRAPCEAGSEVCQVDRMDRTGTLPTLLREYQQQIFSVMQGLKF